MTTQLLTSFEIEENNTTTVIGDLICFSAQDVPNCLEGHWEAFTDARDIGHGWGSRNTSVLLLHSNFRWKTDFPVLLTWVYFNGKPPHGWKEMSSCVSVDSGTIGVILNREMIIEELSSGLGDGGYPIYTHQTKNGEVDGIILDFLCGDYE